jgi:hypothetical protein
MGERRLFAIFALMVSAILAGKLIILPGNLNGISCPLCEYGGWCRALIFRFSGIIFDVTENLFRKERVSSWSCSMEFIPEGA